ncbi:MAG TPA: cytochrome c [Candidatus Binataceae bacterium]|jgi:mono/diheme cytochrome c family protein
MIGLRVLKGRFYNDRVQKLAGFIGSLIAAAVLGLLGCGGPSVPQTPAEVGRRVYMTNCVVCHNPDPNLAGSQGPAIAGSPKDLVEARVMHAAYPPGYKPKRSTHAMVALPQLGPQIDNIVAFLATAKK